MPVTPGSSDSIDPPALCPKDNTLMERLDADGIAVDRCPSCGGIWFDLGELRALMNRADDDLIGELDRTDRRVPASAHTEDRSNWVCPRDGQRLTSLRDPQQPHLEYELCTHCGGVFFDSGELKDLSRVTLLERLRSLL
ncbi:MAG: zf-TFIIB domain-containing protein [Planctomycetota bacterium]